MRTLQWPRGPQAHLSEQRCESVWLGCSAWPSSDVAVPRSSDSSSSTLRTSGLAGDGALVVRTIYGDQPAAGAALQELPHMWRPRVIQRDDGHVVPGSHHMGKVAPGRKGPFVHDSHEARNPGFVGAPMVVVASVVPVVLVLDGARSWGGTAKELDDTYNQPFIERLQRLVSQRSPTLLWARRIDRLTRNATAFAPLLGMAGRQSAHTGRKMWIGDAVRGIKELNTGTTPAEVVGEVLHREAQRHRASSGHGRDRPGRRGSGNQPLPALARAPVRPLRARLYTRLWTTPGVGERVVRPAGHFWSEFLPRNPDHPEAKTANGPRRGRYQVFCRLTQRARRDSNP